MPIKRWGLGRRLGQAFVVQALLIGAAAGVGVYAAALAIEELLIRRALVQEAEHFWLRRGTELEFPVPDTHNLAGYLASPTGSEAGPPPALAEFPLGFHELDSTADLSVLYVTEGNAGRLYLVFDGEQVRELALYFGLAPLALVLLIIYAAAWISYRASRRAVSPVIQLAAQVKCFDPASSDAGAFGVDSLPTYADEEIVTLADALRSLCERIDAFTEREHSFTRDASHELRSPLTVIGLAADMLMSHQELSRPARNSVLRIKRAAKDMEELTEVFLLLARESNRGLSAELVCVNDLVSEEVEQVRHLIERKPVTIAVEETGQLLVRAPGKVLAVLVGNLLRNACLYTEGGAIRVRVEPNALSIKDSGAGMAPEELDLAFEPFQRGATGSAAGYGVGLSLVRRLCERFGWPVSLESVAGEGTRVIMLFPSGSAEPGGAAQWQGLEAGGRHPGGKTADGAAERRRA